MTTTSLPAPAPSEVYFNSGKSTPEAFLAICVYNVGLGFLLLLLLLLPLLLLLLLDLQSFDWLAAFHLELLQAILFTAV